MSSINTENKNLRELCDKLKETNANQFSLVDWYIKFMEKGLNAKDLIKDLLELEEKHEKLTMEHKTMIKDYESKLKSLTGKFNRATAKLKE